MKIVYIGAGSFRFSYGLFRNICAARELFPLDLWLVDVDARVLETMHGVVRQMLAKYTLTTDITVHATTERREALPGADIIYKSISIGQQASEWYDVHVPQKFGIPQNTADTVGPGGVFRTLRCVPVVVDIVRDVAELCPDAPLLNYTNPQAGIVLAARQAQPAVQTIGLCHELFGGMKTIFKFLQKLGRVPKKTDETWEDLDITYAGVNHFAWLLSCAYHGTDVYAEIRANAAGGGKLAGRPYNFHLLQGHGYFPYPGSRHLAEFLPEYYNYFNHRHAAKYWGMPKLRNVKLLRRLRHMALWGYRRVAKGHLLRLVKPTKKGERAIEMTIDHRDSNPTPHVVNLPNTGQRLVSNLPENCVLEVPGRFRDGTIEGDGAGPLPGSIHPLVQVHAANQQKFVDAALSGDPDQLLAALLADPMCAFIEDPDSVEDMMYHMLYYEREWLPAFAESVPSYEDLQKRKQFVSKEDLRKKRRARKVQYPPKPSLRVKAYFP